MGRGEQFTSAAACGLDAGGIAERWPPRSATMRSADPAETLLGYAAGQSASQTRAWGKGWKWSGDFQIFFDLPICLGFLRTFQLF